MKGLPYSNSRGAAQTVQVVRKVTIPVNGLAVTVTGGASTDLGTGTAVLGGFPEGNILLLGAVSYLQFSSADAAVSATWSGSYTVGSAANVAGNQTLDGAEIDVIGATAIADATAKLSAVTRGAKTTAVILNNTDGSLEVNLNMTTDDNDVTDSTAAAFTVDGAVHLVYAVLGDD
jgi:hypothetical protein